VAKWFLLLRITGFPKDSGSLLDRNMNGQAGETAGQWGRMNVLKTMAVASVALLIGMPGAMAQQAHPMGFFVTSTGMGNGANLGGLAGADAHCTKLAEAAGSKGRSWHAYLSTQEKGKRGISARSRIGQGP